MKHRPQEGANAVDMTGQRVGRLTIMSRAGSEGPDAVWLCRCDCGTEKLVRRPQLRGGYTKSCGCLYRESRRQKKPRTVFRLLPGEAALNRLLKNYRGAAKARSLPWQLTANEFRALIEQPCHYCGLSPIRVLKVSANGEVVWNGIDRIDNDLGYIPSNVVTCCHPCNHAKCDMTQSEFLSWVRRVAGHLGL